MKREIILMGFQKFDSGTKSTILGKPKFIAYAYVIYNIDSSTSDSIINKISC